MTETPSFDRDTRTAFRLMLVGGAIMRAGPFLPPLGAAEDAQVDA